MDYEADKDLDELDDDRLAALAVEAALGGRGKHTLTEVARRADMRPEQVREFMQALGRPNPARGERVFTDEDVDVARMHKQFVDAGLPRRELLASARTISQGMAHSAESVRQLVGNALLEPGATSAELGLRYLGAAEQFGPALEMLLGYELRAHLRDRLRSEFVTEEELAAGELADTTDIAVAFADLVDYTRLGERLPPAELGDIANQLAEMATKAAQRPVQMVKTVGDAALFVSRDADALTDTLIALVDAIDAKGARFPQVRVGAAWGAATNRGGDWFGPPVNVASRVTELAKPGRILATEAFAERAPGHEWKRRRRRALHGIANRVRVYELVRPRSGDGKPAGDR